MDNYPYHITEDIMNIFNRNLNVAEGELVTWWEEDLYTREARDAIYGGQTSPASTVTVDSEQEDL